MLHTLTTAYSQAKGAWSFANNLFMILADRAPIPTFHTVEQANAYLMAHGRYKGDPGRGAFDFYTDPRRIQYAMQVGTDEAWSRVSCDCDDWAVWALHAVRKITRARAYLVTLVDDPARITSGAGWMTHVILAGVDQFGRPFAIDTNGLHRPDDLSEPTLIAEWNRIYKAQGARYVAAVVTPEPLF